MKKYTVTQRFDTGLLRGLTIKKQTNVLFTPKRQYKEPLTRSLSTVVAITLNKVEEGGAS